VSLCRDAAAEGALELGWSKVLHYVCEWHLMKNIKEKLKQTLGNHWEVCTFPGRMCMYTVGVRVV
jgi:hypothetical protein